MYDEIYARVRENPKFQELVSRRTRLATILSVIVLVIFYAFIMCVAFAPSVLGTPISEGSTLSIGIPLGAAILVIGWVLTGVYSHFANGPFEQLNAEIVRETQK